ncbi:MAG: hypothetical protein JWN78_2488 [Bacteroidota bacterium]|nr:hypothetical protein [Bacteroidota bacterium]
MKNEHKQKVKVIPPVRNKCPNHDDKTTSALAQSIRTIVHDFQSEPLHFEEHYNDADDVIDVIVHFFNPLKGKIKKIHINVDYEYSIMIRKDMYVNNLESFMEFFNKIEGNPNHWTCGR